MAELNWSSFNCVFYSNTFGEWEVSEYLGDLNVNDYLVKHDSNLDLEASLAKKAALGDILGIGDRHFENYMIRSGDVFSVDVSIMFWPNNEWWSEKYMKAGLYEVATLESNIAKILMPYFGIGHTFLIIIYKL